MTLFSWLKPADPHLADEIQRRRLEESQAFLINAAVAITDVATAVTEKLKRNLDGTPMSATVALRSNDDCLLICGLDGTVAHANSGAIRDFGNPIGRSVTDLFEGIKFESIDNLFAILSDDAAALTLKGRHEDGSVFAVNTKLTYLDWLDRTSSVAILLYKKEADDTARSTLDMSFDGLLVVQDDQIVGINAATPTIFGYETSALLGHSIFGLFPSEQIDRMNDDGKHRYVSGLHDDGSRIDLLFATTGICWNGRHARVITATPISENDLPSRTSQADDNDNGIEMIVCFDKNDKIVFANSMFAQVYNRSRIELVDRNMKDILHADAYEKFLHTKSTITPDHCSCRVQAKHVNEDGTTAIHDWIWYGRFDERGNPTEYTRTGRDISTVIAEIVTQGYF